MESKSNLPSFTFSLRGYDRVEVDEYLESMNDALGQMEEIQEENGRLQAQIGRLNGRIQELEEHINADTPKTGAILGERIGILLRVAEETASDTVLRAEAESARLEEEAKQRLVEADEAARASVARGQEQARRIEAAARAQAAEIASEAEARATARTRQIEQWAEQVISHTRAEEARMLREQEEKRRVALAELRSLAEQRDAVAATLAQLRETLGQALGLVTPPERAALAAPPGRPPVAHGSADGTLLSGIAPAMAEAEAAVPAVSEVPESVEADRSTTDAAGSASEAESRHPAATAAGTAETDREETPALVAASAREESRDIDLRTGANRPATAEAADTVEGSDTDETVDADDAAGSVEASGSVRAAQTVAAAERRDLGEVAGSDDGPAGDLEAGISGDHEQAAVSEGGASSSAAAEQAAAQQPASQQAAAQQPASQQAVLEDRRGDTENAETDDAEIGDLAAAEQPRPYHELDGYGGLDALDNHDEYGQGGPSVGEHDQDDDDQPWWEPRDVRPPFDGEALEDDRQDPVNEQLALHTTESRPSADEQEFEAKLEAWVSEGAKHFRRW